MHVLTQHGVPFAGKIPFFQSAELIQSKKQAERLAQILGDKSVVVMKNHGITVVGKTIEETVILAMDFERAAQEHLLATTFGKPSGMPVAMAKKLSANNYAPAQFRMLWDYYWKKFNRS